VKNLFKLKDMLRIAGIIALVAVIGFSMIACEDGGGGSKNATTYDPTGTWDFTMNGQKATGTITGNKWVFDYPDAYYNDSGTFTRNGNVLTLYSNAWSTNTGTVTLTSNTTGTLTLYSPSLLPGTYSGTKRGG